MAEGFEAPHELFRVLADPSLGRIDGITLYLAELDGVPVGTGMTATSGDLTGLFNITTLPGYRRRGYGRVLTLEMIRAGFAAGAGTAYLYASKMGEPVYAAVGFRTEEYLTVITAPA
ncbi:GNAT family N-acetyltransferase [Streptomyces sp. TUS-ST3]|uniref:GNAT family N-acetyltransferase n=1 Tax=Streptomyces sp. TUS-ST3 TaxID=3025591 RepID=UPI0024E0A431|nr:GNAT family N-acetyltransferase [Streptomyces sp. TUS-ST3]